MCCNDKDDPKYASKLNISGSRVLDDGRYCEYPDNMSHENFYRTRQEPTYREYYRKNYDDEKRRYIEQKASRSFYIRREGYADEEKCLRTPRGDCVKERRYGEKEKRCDKYHHDKTEVRDRFNTSRKDRSRKNTERFEKNSIASKDEGYRNKDKDTYSERERDSGLSVADGETSTISGRSNYLRVVKVSSFFTSNSYD